MTQPTFVAHSALKRLTFPLCRLASWDLAAGDLRYSASQQPHSCLARLGLAANGERVPASPSLQGPVHGTLLRHWVEVAAQVSHITYESSVIIILR